jgi:hypothetical protein
MVLINFATLLLSIISTTIAHRHGCGHNHTRHNHTTSTTLLPSPLPNSSFGIPVVSGTTATLTYFTDTTTQCYGTAIPVGPGLAINPLLLGFTEAQWTGLYSSASASGIPWCGLTLSVTANGQTFTGTIIDTCDPVGNPFPDPTTGQPIGGKCDYPDVIDLYGDTGLAFLNNITGGNDFYDGELVWELV